MSVYLSFSKIVGLDVLSVATFKMVDSTHICSRERNLDQRGSTVSVDGAEPLTNLRAGKRRSLDAVLLSSE